MPDLNDLSKPTPLNTEPDVLDTLRAHIIRAASWTWDTTAGKVAGMMSATTQAVSGGRSMRLYRRNAANTAEEEIVSLPGVSVGGNAATATSAAACTGNAATATALQTARSFTINGIVKFFTGAADVSWSLGELGVPSNSGVGANGNWNINISGNAGNVIDGAITTAKFSANAKPPFAGAADSATNANNAANVPWTGVSARPTAVSAFSNDAGYITAAAALTATAGAALGSVGTYALLYQAGGSATAAGGTQPGSNLRYSNAGIGEGGTPVGTWRVMGFTGQAGGYSFIAVSVWLRIS
jgi:hypothetical protein